VIQNISPTITDPVFLMVLGAMIAIAASSVAAFITSWWQARVARHQYARQWRAELVAGMLERLNRRLGLYVRLSLAVQRRDRAELVRLLVQLHGDELLLGEYPGGIPRLDRAMEDLARADDHCVAVAREFLAEKAVSRGARTLRWARRYYELVI